MLRALGALALLFQCPVHAATEETLERLEEIGRIFNGPPLVCPGVPPGLASGADALGNAIREAFCSDAHEYLCGRDGAAHAALLAREERARAGVLEPAYPRLAARYGFTPANKDGWVAYFAANPSLQADLTAELSRESIAELDARFGSFDDDLTTFSNSVRTALGSAIDSEPALGDGARAALRSRLRGVQVLSSHAAVQVLGAARVATKFGAWCGADGLSDNAFFLDGQVVLCPGFMVTLLEGRRTPGTDLTVLERQDIFMTLAHEIAHSFEGVEGGSAPTAYVDCLEARSGVARDVLLGQMPEILADRWAVAAMASRLSAGGDDARLSLVTRGAQYFCPGSATDTDHPSPEFRLGFVLGRSAAVRSEIGCAPNPPTRLGCGYSGPE